ncbi:MAG: iron-sulfur cluster assembly protein [Saprospiraceae bacterium]
MYELGLIYEIKIDDENNVELIMTLTAPNCPVADNIIQEVNMKINEIEELNNV